MQADWTTKRLVWIPDDKDGYVGGSVRQDKGEDVVVERLDTKQTVSLSKNDCQKMNPPNFEKVNDMADLTCLNEGSILHNLKERYHADIIYTYSGLFCVVVNPYKRLQIYGPETLDEYKGKKRNQLPPHIFAIADEAYRSMLKNRDDQSILCTGESGAGKTENTKKLIHYLAHIAGEARAAIKSPGKKAIEQIKLVSQLENQLLQANPILEAFGNAKTARNDNSSRFGKFIRIHFDQAGLICGANIEFYLLEKSRTCRQLEGERNFHIFYRLLKGATDEEKKSLHLQDVDSYAFLSNKSAHTVPNVNDASDYQATLEAMHLMGFGDLEITALLRVVSATLLLGNLKFVPEKPGSEQVAVQNPDVAGKIGELLGVRGEDLITALVRPQLKMGRELVEKTQTKEQAEFAVEAISKGCYERLFKWLVGRLNRSMDKSRGVSFIGILDIAGFEIFTVNGFEQLLINLTNERLQQFFNHTMFVAEQEEYAREQIPWKQINFGLDLQPTIDLIEKQMGILALVDEECLFPKTTDRTLVEKLKINHTSHQKFIVPEMRARYDFGIQHYAGRVDYVADQWLIKNMDPLNENVIALLKESSRPFVAELWKDVEYNALRDANDALAATRAKRGGMFRTVSQLHKEQLANLMSVLRNTEPHFVRCIIPNRDKKPRKIDAPLVLEQLRCNGVLEGIRICRQGYPNRVSFYDFRHRYELLTPGVVQHGVQDSKEIARKMLESLEVQENLYQIGQTKIFFKAGTLASLEEKRDARMLELVVALQAQSRIYLARRSERKAARREKAIRIIQRAGLQWNKQKTSAWWHLLERIRPFLKFTSATDLLAERERDLQHSKQLNDDKDAELAALREKIADMEQERKKDEQKRSEQVKGLRDSIARLESDHTKERRKHADELQTLKVSYESAEIAHHKLLEDARQKFLKALADNTKKLEAEATEARERHEAARKKHREESDAQISELEQKLEREEALRKQLSQAKRTMESELQEHKDTIASKTARIDDLNSQLAKVRAELATALSGINEESLSKMQKEQRQLDSRMKELNEDIELERAARAKAERLKRDLSSELESLKADHEDAADKLASLADAGKKKDEQIRLLEGQLDSIHKQHEAELKHVGVKLQRQADEKLEQVKSDAQLVEQRFERTKKRLTEEVDDLTLEGSKNTNEKFALSRRIKLLEKEIAECKAQIELEQNNVKKADEMTAREKQRRENLRAKMADLEQDIDNERARARRLQHEIDELNEKIEYLHRSNESRRIAGSAVQE